MAESEETGLECQVSHDESDDNSSYNSSFEVIEDPTNPKVSRGFFMHAFAFYLLHRGHGQYFILSFGQEILTSYSM